MPVVQGYSYDNQYSERHKTVCQIIDRAEIDEIVDFGIAPTFLIRFSDGHEMTAVADCLHPWYPVD